MDIPDNPDLQAALQLTEFNVAYAQVDRHILYKSEDGEFAGRLESDAEHSYKLADLAQALVPRLNPDLDLASVLRFCLHHDKIEKIVGDTSIFASDELVSTKIARESAGLPALARELSLHPEIVDLVHEYEARSTPEARFVYALDKIDAILTIIHNNGLTWKEANITSDKHRAKRIELRSKVALAPELLPMFDAIAEYLEEHSEHFATEP